MNMRPQGAEKTAADFGQALALFRGKHYSEAAKACRELLAVQPRHGQALHLLGVILADQGRMTEGLAALEEALQFDSHDPALRGAYALLLFRAGRLEDAETAVRTALALQPAWPDLLDILGSILWRRGDPETARECFDRALQQAPTHPGAWANLALLNEQSNRVDEALGMAEQGLARRPEDVSLRLVLGRCLRRRGQMAAARTVLGKLREDGTPALRKDVEYELALCADAMGDAEAAFAHCSRANTLARELAPQVLEEGQSFAELTERLRDRFTPEWVGGWRVLPAETGRVTPIFLVGFPRSGTTLLDSMLGAHPDLTVLEERPVVQAVLDSVARLPGGYPNALAALTAAERTALMEEYFRIAAEHAGGGKRILDKSPFLTLHLGLIQRIFSGAPILFMVRHPCDVVLSCFMTNLELNAGTAHFVALESAVSLYCKVISLWRRYLEVLPLNYRRVRYEDLLDRPEEELRGITAFLGLPWSESVLRHSTHVATRGRIASASYAQVSEPLYLSARDRWRRYAKYLNPHLSDLQPYCELFGYDLG